MDSALSVLIGGVVGAELERYGVEDVAVYEALRAKVVGLVLEMGRVCGVGVADLADAAVDIAMGHSSVELREMVLAVHGEGSGDAESV